MGAARVERSTSPLVANSISPPLAYSTNPTVVSTTSYSPVMDFNPKDMPETAFVIAFCVKFRTTINNISFWPEDLDEAICCKEGPNPLIESLHKAFIHNLELKKPRTSWIKRLAKLINDWREKGHDFFVDYNPIERANYDYYIMSNRDKVMIMQLLVSWQLAESPEIKRIRKEHNEIVNDDDFKPLEVEVLGEDASGSRYYYIGIGVRIYRESIISGRIKWETVSTTVDELRKFVFDYQGLDPNRSEKERVLYNKVVSSVLPYLEPLENERKRLKEDKDIVLHKEEREREREREARLKRIEKIHNDAEIILVRTRSQAKRAVHKEVKTATGYLEIIKNPIDPTITTISNDNKAVANTSSISPTKRKFMDNVNGTIKCLEDPTTIQEFIGSGNSVKDPVTNGEDDDLVATDKVTDPATSSSIQKSAENDIFKDPSTKISTAVDFSEIATESKVPLEEVIIANNFNGAVDTSTSEDMSDRDDKRPSKNGQNDENDENDENERPRKIRRDNSSSKMNLSSILTEEVSKEAESVGQRSELSKMAILTEEVSKEAESVGQRSELSKMAISNILSSESSDVVHTGSKYFEEDEVDNVNSEHVGPMFLQYGNGSVVSYEFDTIVQKSNNKKETKESEKVAPDVAIQEQNNLQKGSNTPNVSNDTISTPWTPTVKKNRKKMTAEVDDVIPNELKIRRAFVPDAEMMIKLEWSLNHPVFRLDEEVFGESTDTDLSECCSSCAMEID